MKEIILGHMNHFENHKCFMIPNAANIVVYKYKYV